MCNSLEGLRREEIEALRSFFPAGTRVLELGGGSGYQASVLASWGCQVTSIDLPGRPAGDVQYHPVQDYDGVHLPFPNGAFEIVFSSNVLEHVRDLQGLLGETRRVLVPGGLGVHLMPSVPWRFWTCLTHYVYALSRVLGRRVRQDRAVNISVADKVSTQGWPRVLRKILLPSAHGEYPSAAAELYYFSRFRWGRVFARAGFDIRSADGHGLFYTGYGVWPGLGLGARRTMARLLGSSCNRFVLVRPERDP